MNERSPPDSGGQDAALDAAWRRNSREEPSPAIDEAIRAAARRRVVSRPGGDKRARESAGLVHRSVRWVPVAAAAGVAALAFGLLRWLPVDRPFAPSAPASPAADADTALDNAAGELVRMPAQPRAETAPLADEPASARRESAVPASPPADIAAQSKQMQAPVQERRELAPVSAQTAASAAASPSANTQEAAARAPAPAPAQETTSITSETTNVTGARPAARQDSAGQMRLEQIADLYTAGRLDDAAAMLRELRRTDPHADERLPVGLRSWAATVRD